MPDVGLEPLPPDIPDDVRGRVFADLRSHFRPEFLNRVDEIVLFKPLTLEELERIVELQIEAVRSRLAEQRLALELTEAGRALVGRKGYDPV